MRKTSLPKAALASAFAILLSSCASSIDSNKEAINKYGTTPVEVTRGLVSEGKLPPELLHDYHCGINYQEEPDGLWGQAFSVQHDLWVIIHVAKNGKVTVVINKLENLYGV